MPASPTLPDNAPANAVLIRNERTYMVAAPYASGIGVEMWRIYAFRKFNKRQMEESAVYSQPGAWVEARKVVKGGGANV